MLISAVKLDVSVGLWGLSKPRVAIRRIFGTAVVSNFYSQGN